MSETHRLSDIRIRDPFILESPSGGYVLYGTTDENVWGGPAAGFDCYTSDDLNTWRGPTAAFRPPADFWSNSQFWAPEVHEYRGRYYLFATFMPTQSQVRGIAGLVSDSATGPFHPWSDGPITPPGWAQIVTEVAQLRDFSVTDTGDCATLEPMIAVGRRLG